MHSHNEKTLEPCTEPLCKKGGFVVLEVCCPRFAKEPQYHNTICEVYQNWHREVELNGMR